MNQGLLDVKSLSQILETGSTEGQDIGSIHLLRKYASERYVRNIAMISSCDKLHRLFGTDSPPVTWIRSLGLNAVNNLDFVKVTYSYSIV
jgi:ubiquinone biosynthesis monooxygenase Coq6